MEDSFAPFVVIVLKVLITAGIWAVVPLGLGLVTPEDMAYTRRRWFVPAPLAIVGLWAPRSLPQLTLLPLLYLVLTGILAVVAVRRFRRRTAGGDGAARPVEVAVAAALVAPFVGSLALVAERVADQVWLGAAPETFAAVVVLTHVSGFAALLVTALVARGAAEGRVQAAVVGLVMAGVVVSVAGWFAAGLVALVGAGALAAGTTWVARLTWRQVRPGIEDQETRTLLGGSTVVLAVACVAGFAVALLRAAGPATEAALPALYLATDTVVAVAAGLALLAWSRLRPEPL